MGWSYEVTASNGVIIAKCMLCQDAQEIVKRAEKIDKENHFDD